MLKRNMGTGDQDDDDETTDGEPKEAKPDHLSFDKLSSGVSRRTASSVFFELLQLKVSDGRLAGVLWSSLRSSRLTLA